MVVDEGGGRFAFADQPQSEARRELCAAYCCVAAAAPLLAQRQDTSLHAGRLCHALASCLRSPFEWQQQMAVLALGHANAAHYDRLVGELQGVIRDSNAPTSGRSAKARPRRDELRTSVGHVWRQLLDAMPPSRLRQAHGLRSEAIKFLRSTAEVLREPAASNGAFMLPAAFHVSMCACACPKAWGQGLTSCLQLFWYGLFGCGQPSAAVSAQLEVCTCLITLPLALLSCSPRAHLCAHACDVLDRAAAGAGAAALLPVRGCALVRPAAGRGHAGGASPGPALGTV